MTTHGLRETLSAMRVRLEYTRDAAVRAALREQLREVITEIRHTRTASVDGRPELNGAATPGGSARASS
jgi:hypothetical protein